MASANISALSNDNFETTIKDSGTPVLVDFWAPWCGPCKAIAPILEEIAEEMAGKVKIYKVDVDESQEVAARYNIRAIPTLIVFKNGSVVDQMIGMTSKSDLKSKLSALL